MFEEEINRYIEVNMNSVEQISEKICKAKFCYHVCPVEPKNAFLGCNCRPVKHMKECPRLKAYLKKEKRKNEHRKDTETNKEKPQEMAEENIQTPENGY